jgi:uncharacterized protein (TIGR03546 family)
MFLIRKIGKVLRGAATPFQVHLACILGAMLGFVPSFSRSPALVVGLVLLLVILNANLALVTILAGFAKLASLALMPVSFAFGRLLLDGPTRPLFVKLVNAPVTAFLGLEWYVCAGGLALGLLLGVGTGLLVNVPLKQFRLAMTKVEGANALYERWRHRKLARVVLWLFFGPRHKWDSYRETMTRTVGMPIRVSGVVLAALVVGAIWFGASRLSTGLLTSSLKDGLERMNGATVDLGKVELDLGNSRLAVHDLALADSEELDEDLFRSTLLECDVSGADLLRKRLKLDRVVARDAHHGLKRDKPGVRRAPPPEPEPPPPGTDADDKTLDEWLADAQKWKQRLAQAKRWLDKVKRAPAEPTAGEPTLRERLEKEVEQKGWRNVAATHLIEGAPAFEVGELLVEGMTSEELPGRLIDLRCENLSTNPALVDGAPRVKLSTRDEFLGLDANFGGEARTPGTNALTLKCVGLPAEAVQQAIAAKSGTKAFEGGTIDAGFHLAWSAGGVAAFDTPLDVKLKDTTVTLSKTGATKVKELGVPLHLRGPLDNPRVRLDAEAFTKSLAAAGVSGLEEKAKERAQEEIDDAAKKALEKLDPFGRKKKKDGGP